MNLAVDAACSGNPGPMEYQGIDLDTRKRIFHVGPIQGTNNIGEFLAVVHAISLLLRDRPATEQHVVYTDSRTALAWLRTRKAKTTLARTPATAAALELTARATRWLLTHEWPNVEVRKWDTDLYGEIPADFGRK